MEGDPPSPSSVNAPGSPAFWAAEGMTGSCSSTSTAGIGTELDASDCNGTSCWSSGSRVSFVASVGGMYLYRLVRVTIEDFGKRVVLKKGHLTLRKVVAQGREKSAFAIVSTRHRNSY